MAGVRRIAGLAALVLALSACATLTEVSAPAGDHTAGTSYRTFGVSGPVMSGDGQFSVFDAPRSSTDATVEVYRHDALSHTNVRVSVDAAGAPVGGRNPAISADGRYVAFLTTAPLVAEDTNFDQAKGWFGWDAYVRDVQTGTVWRASVDPAGAQIITGGGFELPLSVYLSADGRYVAFSTRIAAGRTFIATHYVRDRQATKSTLVTSGYSAITAISGDGMHVLVDDYSSCITFCPEAAGSHVFDWKDGTSMSIGCETGAAALSDDGRYVAAIQTAKNGCTAGVVRIDRQSGGAATRFPGGLAPTVQVSGLSMSGTGRRLAIATPDALLPSDTNGASDIYVGDFATGDVGIASRTATNAPADGPSEEPALSGDGGYVRFATLATNLAPDDHDGLDDLVLTPAIRPVIDSVTPATAARGTMPRLTITGHGFDPNVAAVLVTGSGVWPGEPTVTNTTVKEDVTVAPDALPGARDVVVIGHYRFGTVSAWCFGCLTVT